MFPESHGFVSLHELDNEKLEHVFDTACDWNSNEPVTLRKHVTEYKNMQKWMVEFSENPRVVAIKLLE